MGDAFWLWILDMRKMLRESTDKKKKSNVERIVTIVHNGNHFVVVEVEPWHNLIKLYDSMPAKATLKDYHETSPIRLIARELKRHHSFTPTFIVNPMVLH